MDFPKSVPGVGLVGGQFVDENPSIGQQGSLIPAAWGNAVTQELLAVIREAGIEPDEDQTDQLRMAIRSMWATVEKPGVLRKASSADMLDADCDDAAVTPAALAARTATESRTGLVELATQGEAEAGTDNTRVPTVLRVHQAIVAGYNALTSAFGRTLASSADAAAARTTLELGNAAVLNATESNKDKTLGRVLKVGDGGWLGDVPIFCENIDDRTQRGWWYVSTNTLGVKPSNVGIVLTYGNSDDAIIQEFVEIIGGADTGIRRRFIRNCYRDNPWSPWCELYHSGNLQLPLGQGQMWHNATAWRAASTTYTNSTGRAIAVAVSTAISAAVERFINIGCNGVEVAGISFDTNVTTQSIYAIIPAGATYIVDTNATINYWAELR